MKTPCLIIFAKQPKLGFVKTRLAKESSDELALSVAKHSLHRLLQKASSHWHGKVQLWLSDTQGFKLPDHLNHIEIKQQKGHSLGDKMADAISSTLEQMHHPVIIGADIAHLPLTLLKEINIQGKQNKSFIGPCEDGGYYVISHHSSAKNMFNNIDWGTDKAYEQTIASCLKSNLHFDVTLDTFFDLDHLEDLVNACNYDDSFKQFL